MKTKPASMKTMRARWFCARGLALMILACTSVKAQLPPDFPALTITTCNTNAVGAGYIFLEVTDSSTNAGYYLMMLKNDGTPVWYQNVTNHNYDFKVLPNGYLHYAPFLHTHSWTGGGDATHQILDGGYNPEETIIAGNGYAADAHDFQLLPNGHVLLNGYYRTQMDVSKYVVGGYPNALIAGAIIQELDADRNVVFQWRSWDHFTIPTYFPPTAFTNSAAKNPVIDAFHINTVIMDTDGNLLVSNFGMDVWKINRQTGQIMWRLGGPANQFTFANENPLQALGHFSGHTLSRLDNGNILIYCNADQQATRSSKVYEYKLDEAKKTATLVWSYAPPTNFYAWHYGSAQRLANGNTFIGWGGANIMPGIGGFTNQWIPACTEVAPDGTVVYQLVFNDPKMASYRAYRFVYPPAAQAIVSSVYEPANGNTYSFDPTGVSMTVQDGGGGYTSVTATREPYAPVNSLFRGKAPRVLPLRVSLSDSGIYELGAELDFDTASFGFADPSSLTVYYRTNTGQGAFLPQLTAYNPVAHTLAISMTMFSPNYDLGEFIFGYPDVADLANPPILAAVESYTGDQPYEVIGALPATPGTDYSVNQGLPVCLAWSPQGLAGSYHLQISDNADFSSTVVDLPGLTEAFFVWSDTAPGTSYYYRVSTSNDGGTSAWSNGAFHTIPPMVAVAFPNGGEAWQRGQKQFIQWQNNTGEPVVIDLYKSGVYLATLATNVSTPNTTTGAYLWPISLSLIPGSDYSIMISSAIDGEIFSMSDQPFSIDVPRITGIHQNPDGAWVLQWGGTSSSVYIESNPTLEPDQWQTLDGPITGSAWTNTIPGPQNGFYRLRLQ
jgi:hypothetical protein